MRLPLTLSKKLRLALSLWGWSGKWGSVCCQRGRRRALFLLLTSGPGLLIQPGWAFAPLPDPVKKAESFISADLLPDKSDSRQEARAEPATELRPQADAPILGEGGDHEVAPMVLALPEAYAFEPVSNSPYFQILAGPEDPVQEDAAPPEDGAVPDPDPALPDAPKPVDPVAEQELPDAVPPTEEVGMPPPDEKDEDWQPTEPIGPPGGQADPDPSIAPGGAIPIAPGVGECEITGEVFDVTTLDPIPGAIVVVQGTGREAETDAQGRFRVAGLPPGDYLVEGIKLGYENATVSGSPRPDSPAEVRLGLRKKPDVDTAEGEYLLGEESVIGEFAESGRADLEISIDLGQNLSSGLDKSEFSRSGISDAAGAVSKIAGANIVGGKYAVVRGLGDRYSNTIVNGALISSADPSKKAVQLDLFPSDLLESINIFKTFSPNYPGEFAGGLVAIETLKFPDEPVIKFEVGTGINENLDSDTFWAAPGRDLGALGKNTDSLPPEVGFLSQGGLTSGVTSTRPPAAGNPIAEEAIGDWSALHQSAGMRPVKRDPRRAEDVSAVIGKTFELQKGIDLGVVVAGTWGQGDVVREGVQVGRGYGVGLDGIPETPDDSLGRTQTEDRYTAYAGYGLLASAGLRLKDRHELIYTYFQNHRGEDNVVRGRKVSTPGSTFGAYLPSGSNPFGAGAYTYQAFDAIDPLQRTLTLNQLNGSHKLGDDEVPLELNWGLSRSESLEARPHSRTLYFSELDFTDPRIVSEQGDVYDPSLGVVYTLPDVYQNSPPLVESFRESLETKEESGNERLDLAIPLWHRGKDSFKLSVGGSHFDREREVRGRLFSYRIGGRLNTRLISDSGQYGVDYLDSFDSIYEPDGTLKFDGWSGNPSRSNELILLEQSRSGRTVRNVDAGTDLTAGYLMGSLDLGRWQLVGGVRREAETRSYQILPGLNPTVLVNPSPVESDSVYWLPGIILTRTFGTDEEFDLTLGWSRTVARPTFYEFAPVITQDQATGDEVEGNPDLTDTLITNYDLSVGWRPNSETSISAGLFHKSMEDPIAQAYSATRRTWVNGEQGTLQGIEIEASQRFAEYWLLSGNFTYIDSLLSYFQSGASTGPELVNTSFEGQPEHILNLNFGYDNPDTGWAANLAYNFTGSYLTGVPLGASDRAVRRDSFSQLDLIVQKRIDLWGGDGIVKLKCGNILDSTDKESFEGTDLVYRSYKPGRSFSLSFTYEY